MKFRFRWIPFIAALAVAAVGIALGQWQTRRAAEKDAIEARLLQREAAAPLTLDGTLRGVDDAEYRRVRIRGEFLRDWNLYLDNRPYKGAAGFYVLTPMKIADTNLHVLVARGWTRRDVADRTRLPTIASPQGTVTIDGVIRRTAGQVLELGEASAPRPGAIVQNVDAVQVGQVAGLNMAPFVVEQVSDAQDGLVRDWPRPSAGTDRHRGYAFQWYALAATAILFFIVTGFRRGTK